MRSQSSGIILESEGKQSPLLKRVSAVRLPEYSATNAFDKGKKVLTGKKRNIPKINENQKQEI
jgi:hypothetical protein